jgi:hypothetical protein
MRDEAYRRLIAYAIYSVYAVTGELLCHEGIQWKKHVVKNKVQPVLIH